MSLKTINKDCEDDYIDLYERLTEGDFDYLYSESELQKLVFMEEFNSLFHCHPLCFKKELFEKGIDKKTHFPQLYKKFEASLKNLEKFPLSKNEMRACTDISLLIETLDFLFNHELFNANIIWGFDVYNCYVVMYHQ